MLSIILFTPWEVLKYARNILLSIEKHITVVILTSNPVFEITKWGDTGNKGRLLY